MPFAALDLWSRSIEMTKEKKEKKEKKDKSETVEKPVESMEAGDMIQPEKTTPRIDTSK